GAGSSAYIGETIEHLFRVRKGIAANAIPTTTLVTNFEDYIDVTAPLLLISFARSGNSPESMAVVEIAELLCDDVTHIALTCNSSGKLAKKIKSLPNGMVMMLPSASEDKGLAMTGSFTSMMLAGIYLSKIPTNENLTAAIERIAEDTRKVIESYAPALKSISGKDFDRIVFLGSGPLLGIARESHLKVQELTDGEVVGKFDSFLGFRHGPKAVVNGKTLMVFLFSPDMNVFRYEKDLVEEVIQENHAMNCIGVFYNRLQAAKINPDISILSRQDITTISSDFDLLPYVLPAQIIGYYKSLQLGLNPDTPSRNNAISRVVKGVKIYQYQ
ncbi:MAG: hypothetical protein WD599_05830, partial [Balneolaceae bacterium]